MGYEAERGHIVMAFGGEAMITRALAPFSEPAFLAIRDLLRAADVRFANGEMLFHNYEDPPTYLSQTYMRCDPRFIADLQWFGINLLSCANNHAYDFGENGVLTNIRSLDAAGMTHAGTGRNLADASAAAYLDTPNGRVALVSATSSGRANSRAGEQRRDMQGRPGANLVRWINEWTVDVDAFASLSRIASEFGWNRRLAGWWTRAYGFEQDDPEVVNLGDRNALGVNSEDLAARFIRGDGFAHHSRIHQADLERNVLSVADARRMADWVIYSVHSHEGGATIDEPADHLRTLAHAVVDAGADVVIGHGPHRDRGIEIYQGRPIFYSLGNFIMQNDTVWRMPHDSMVLYGLGHEHTPADLFDARIQGREAAEAPGPGWWSAIPVVTFSGGQLEAIELHPIELGWSARNARSQFGRPLLASGDLARSALERFRRLSSTFGTEVALDGEIGHVSTVASA
jgi:poly-gamma-glutamate synthesis protein (capsule biosynthesis protein)